MPLTKVTGDNIDNFNFSIGITTATSITATNIIGTNLNISGVSTHLSTTLIGSGTSTGTASQTLQVTGGAYVSGSLGIGVASPAVALHVASGDIRISDSGANQRLLRLSSSSGATELRKIGRAHV